MHSLLPPDAPTSLADAREVGALGTATGSPLRFRSYCETDLPVGVGVSYYYHLRHPAASHLLIYSETTSASPDAYTFVRSVVPGSTSSIVDQVFGRTMSGEHLGTSGTQAWLEVGNEGPGPASFGMVAVPFNATNYIDGPSGGGDTTALGTLSRFHATGGVGELAQLYGRELPDQAGYRGAMIVSEEKTIADGRDDFTFRVAESGTLTLQREGDPVAMYLYGPSPTEDGGRTWQRIGPGNAVEVVPGSYRIAVLDTAWTQVLGAGPRLTGVHADDELYNAYAFELLFRETPNLSATITSELPDSAGAGQSFSVSIRVDNTGGDTRASWSIYLSQDATITSDDVLLASGPFVAGLDQDTSGLRTLTVTLPGGLSAGHLFIGAVATAGGPAGDADLSDNVAVARLAIVETRLQGGDGSDVLVGSGVDERLVARGGDDILRGNGGADTLSGGLGSDAASYSTASAAVRASLADGGTRGDAAGDVYLSIERLFGSGYDDRLIGNAGANAIGGFGGNDSLMGGDGGDRLSGGLGADTLLGGSGDDALSGGLGADHLAGGDGDDVLFGDAQDDTLSGGAGDDRLRGGSGRDAFVFAGALPGGIDTIADFDAAVDAIAFVGGQLDRGDVRVAYDGRGAVVSAPEVTIHLLGLRAGAPIAFEFD